MGFGDFVDGFGKGFNMVFDPILHNPLTDFGSGLFKRVLNFGDATISLVEWLPYILIIGGGLFIFVQVKNAF